MSIERVREYFRECGIEDKILEFDVSSATVPLAALALGTEEARIAKTMSFKKDEGRILVITAGDGSDIFPILYLSPALRDMSVCGSFVICAFCAFSGICWSVPSRYIYRFSVPNRSP